MPVQIKVIYFYLSINTKIKHCFRYKYASQLGHDFRAPKLEHARLSIIFAQKLHLMNGEIDIMMNKVLKN